jgi:hypothetical protein
MKLAAISGIYIYNRQQQIYIIVEGFSLYVPTLHLKSLSVCRSGRKTKATSCFFGATDRQALRIQSGTYTVRTVLDYHWTLDSVRQTCNLIHVQYVRTDVRHIINAALTFPFPLKCKSSTTDRSNPCGS